YIQFAKNPINFLKRIVFTFYQRKGIKNARLIICEKQASKLEEKINKLNIDSRRVKKSIPIIHLKTYSNLESKSGLQLAFFGKYKKLRERYDLVLFHPVRHSWKNPLDPMETKGNDFLFKGFSLLKKLYPSLNACIITIEYGAEVNESKALCIELGINDHVHWFPLQSRKEIMGGIYHSDIVVGELMDSFNLYGVVIEAIAMGKPIMNSRVDEDFTEDYPDLYSNIFANSPEIVCDRIIDYINNPEYFKNLAQQNIFWYKKNIVDNFLHHVNSLINKSSGRPS
ncbi:glycosyltransferase, partial [Sediminibacterium salmoneum]|uniref:glycosyltransferase n=1 Tax=Sediminibacterium salmoneum TaxID=426421 RepID=UPI000564C05B